MNFFSRHPNSCWLLSVYAGHIRDMVVVSTSWFAFLEPSFCLSLLPPSHCIGLVCFLSACASHPRAVAAERPSDAAFVHFSLILSRRSANVPHRHHRRMQTALLLHLGRRPASGPLS